MTRRQPWDLFTVFPAHAGVILKSTAAKSGAVGIPRTRGGDPDDLGAVLGDYKYSPHTRG